jgi:hypothetical protein
MKRKTFGLISGMLSSVMMLLTVPLLDRIGFDHGEIFGYSAIVLSFLLVFFGCVPIATTWPAGRSASAERSPSACG